MITVFKNITKTDNPYHIGIDKAFKRIKSGQIKTKIGQIRNTPDKDARNELKKDLPCILFSGKFSKRKNEACMEHSGYVALDFDGMENGQYDQVFEELKTIPYAAFTFRSPSGNGIKSVWRITANIELHKQLCEGVKEFIAGNKLLNEYYDHFHDIARVCYESYDPEAHLNNSPETFTKYVKKRAVTTTTVNDPIKDDYAIYTRLKTWMDNKNEYYEDGNKHNFLVKLSAACNRFGIDKYNCLSYLKGDFLHAASLVNPEDYDTIVSKVYTLYSNNHGISEFENTTSHTAIFKETGDTDDLSSLDDVDIARDVIYLDDVRESMINGYRHGYAKGETTGFPEIDRRWTWKRGEVTIVTGIGNHGKSTLLMQLALVKAVTKDYKFAVFSPEQNPPNEFYNELIHMLVGMSTEPHHSNQMPEDVYLDAADFIGEHFFYLYPESNSPTPKYIMDRFVDIISKHKVAGCIIDPFNQLDNDWKSMGRDDLYISSFLSKYKRFAQSYDIFCCIVTHPTKSLPRTKEGDYEPPRVLDLSGGAMWNNKSDNILIVHRPYKNSNPESTSVKFISDKIKKQKLVGRPGEVHLKFDLYRSRYFQALDGHNPLIGNPFDSQHEELRKAPF